MARHSSRPDRLLLLGLGYARPFINWAFLLVGLAGAVGTAAGWLPPFSGSWWAKVTSVLLWLVLAMQGYDALSEVGEEVIEEEESPSSSSS